MEHPLPQALHAMHFLFLFALGASRIIILHTAQQVPK